MITHQSRRILEARENVFPSQRRIFLEDLCDGIARSQEFKDCLHGNSRPANHGTAIANIRDDDHTLFHSSNNIPSAFKFKNS